MSIVTLAPSILAADCARLGQQVAAMRYELGGHLKKQPA